MSYSYISKVFPKYTYSTVYNQNVYDNVLSPKIDSNSNFQPSNSINTHSSLYPEKEIITYNKPILETYDNTTTTPSTTQSEHDNAINHILECNQCRSILLKQFNIETERIQHNEILELIMNIIYGFFILLLIELIKQ